MKKECNLWLADWRDATAAAPQRASHETLRPYIAAARRATAVSKGLVTEDAAARLRDRQAIKLIFKSGYTTMTSAPGDAPHGTGMALVRRYVHEAGGKIALATLLGHETRFKVSLPPPAGANAKQTPSSQVA